MRSRAALLPTQSSICYIAERDASTLFLAPITGLPRRKRPGCMTLARRIKPIRARLPVALLADCCFFTAVSDFAAILLHQASRFCRCVAISAGWKMTAAARVVRSDRPISLPMLDVPGWCEKYSAGGAILTAIIGAIKNKAAA